MQVKHQPVLAPFGNDVQPRAYQAQQRFIGLDLPDFKRGYQSVVRQLVPRFPQAGGPGYPQHHLQVAQPAGRLFAIGLQRIRRVFKFVMPLPHFQRFGDKKCFGIESLVQLFLQAGVAAFRPGDQAHLQQRGLHRHILGRFLNAMHGCTHTGADLQAAVPAVADEGFHLELEHGVSLDIRAVRQEQQYIHIRIREQFAPAESAHRDQAGLRWKVAALPQQLQGGIGQFAQFLQQSANTPGRRAASRQCGQHSRLADPVLLAKRSQFSHKKSLTSKVQKDRP